MTDTTIPVLKLALPTISGQIFNVVHEQLEIGRTTRGKVPSLSYLAAMKELNRVEYDIENEDIRSSIEKMTLTDMQSSVLCMVPTLVLKKLRLITNRNTADLEIIIRKNTMHYYYEGAVLLATNHDAYDFAAMLREAFRIGFNVRFKFLGEREKLLTIDEDFAELFKYVRRINEDQVDTITFSYCVIRHGILTITSLAPGIYIEVFEREINCRHVQYVLRNLDNVNVMRCHCDTCRNSSPDNRRRHYYNELENRRINPQMYIFQSITFFSEQPPRMNLN